MNKPDKKFKNKKRKLRNPQVRNVVEFFDPFFIKIISICLKTDFPQMNNNLNF